MAQKQLKTKSVKEFEAWCNKEMQKMQSILLTNDFDLSNIKRSGSKDCSYSQFRYPYKDIEISYSDSVYDYWKSGDKETAYKVLLHEMIHPITDKLYGVACERFISPSQLETEREQLTDHFTNVIYKLLNR